jgi:hypothetical protein
MYAPVVAENERLRAEVADLTESLDYWMFDAKSEEMRAESATTEALTYARENERLRAEIAAVMTFLEKRAEHARVRIEGIQADHGVKSSDTHTYYGGQTLGYWQGRKAALFDARDKLEEITEVTTHGSTQESGE